jgi:hypothetical protein
VDPRLSPKARERKRAPYRETHDILTQPVTKNKNFAAGSMLQTLESYAASNFHFLWPGDESWMFQKCYHRTLWAASWEEVDELERPTHYHWKRMVTVFCNGTREYSMNILPRSRSMDISSFAGEYSGGLEDICDAEGRNPHERKRQLHFDKSRMPNTRLVMGQLE